MTRDQVLAAADRAAQAVWNRNGHWLEPHLSLGMVAPMQLMQALLDNSGKVSAELLYRCVVGPELAERPWRLQAPVVRAAFEVFRATYLVLRRLDFEPDVARAERAFTTGA